MEQRQESDLILCLLKMLYAPLNIYGSRYYMSVIMTRLNLVLVYKLIYFRISHLLLVRIITSKQELSMSYLIGQFARLRTCLVLEGIM